MLAVNVAFGGWYGFGQARLSAHLAGQSVPFTGYGADAAFKPAAMHARAPYSFKPRALIDANRDADADSLLWLDASCVPTRWVVGALRWAVMLSPVVAMHTGFSVGQWCNDAALEVFGLSREEARSIPLVAGGVVAFNMRRGGGDALEEWRRFAEETTVFQGRWEDHRHDQTALSVILWRAGIPILPGDAGLFSYGRGSGGLFELVAA